MTQMASLIAVATVFIWLMDSNIYILHVYVCRNLIGGLMHEGGRNCGILWYMPHS